MKRLLVTHVYNEEYLLPWWLRHHRELFDHGVILDYASDDGSHELYRELVPTWDVVHLGSNDFSAEAADRAVVSVEAQFDDWKIALNTTEFFCCPSIGEFVSALDNSDADAFAIRGVVMVDPPYATEEPDSGIPLVTQRHHGYFEDERIARSEWQRNRIIHRAEHGHYDLGRHRSYLPTEIHPAGALILWYGFSPWTRKFKSRKLQVQTRIPETDRQRSLGKQHFIDEAGLEQRRLEQWKLAENLLARPEFVDVVKPHQHSEGH